MIEMILRVANENDIQLLFDWANDPKVRENSFSTDYIQYADHIKWFTAIMNDKHRKQYIAEVNGQPVGQIRVAVDGEKAMIGYSVAKEFRGKGYASQMLQEIKRVIPIDFPQVKLLIGEVKESNMRSQKAFLASGYTKKCFVFECGLGG